MDPKIPPLAFVTCDGVPYPVNYSGSIPQKTFDINVTVSVFLDMKEVLDVVRAPKSKSRDETLHLLSTKNNADRLRASIAQLDAGRGIECDF